MYKTRKISKGTKKIFCSIIIGLSFFIVFPTKAQYNYSVGSLLKQANSQNSAVYYIASDRSKYIFPDLKTYNTWYSDFSGVITVPMEALDTFPDGGVMPYRQGSKLITHPNTNKIYAVEPNGVLRHIPTAEIAEKLYGFDWYKRVQDVSPGFFSSSYTIGEELGDVYPTGAIVQDRVTQGYYYIKDGAKNKFSNLVSVQWLLDMQALDELPIADLSDYPSGLDITNSFQDLLGFNPVSKQQCLSPNPLSTKLTLPDDPYFNYQVGLHNLGEGQDESSTIFDIDIDAPEAWSVTTGSKDIIIAFIDQGINIDHEDTKDNLWINSDEIAGNGIDDDNNGYIDDIYGWDFMFNDADVSATDTEGDYGPFNHGQMVAGVAAARGNNGKGITGVCWDCKIMMIKTVGLPADAIYYAVDNGADIINISKGGSSEALKKAIDYAYNSGVILIGGAGNNGEDRKFYPSAYDNVLAVAGYGFNDRPAWWSNYGSWVDVSAPGRGYSTRGEGNTYLEDDGTSLSAPYVAGLAGLILSQNPNFSSEEVYTIIRSSVDDVEASGKYFGTGRINAAKALQYNSIPIARFDSTMDDVDFSKPFNIVGTASGKSFVNYKLEYGYGNYPKEWNLLKESDSPVTDEILYNFDPKDLSPRPYTFKLTVTDACGNVAIDKFNFKVLSE